MNHKGASISAIETQAPPMKVVMVGQSGSCNSNDVLANQPPPRARLARVCKHPALSVTSLGSRYYRFLRVEGYLCKPRQTKVRKFPL